MTIEKKLLGTNPSGGGGADNVADVFSTYLYKGTSSAHTITNGIDLAGEGGMVWIKDRSTSKSNAVFDTERGATKRIQTDKTQAEITSSTALTSFNSNGFTVQDTVANESPDDFVSWTFRKKAKFFDVVTYTGNGVAGRSIAHGLNGAVGMMFVKSTTSAGNWFVQHKNIGNGNILRLNTTDAATDSSTSWNSTSPDDSVFTLGSYSGVNANGETYVAYLFADNTSEAAANQMIKCGSYTGNGSAAEVNLGWEPQYVLIKSSSTSADWHIFDTMRGIVTNGPDKELYANLPSAEYSWPNAPYRLEVTPTGFTVESLHSRLNGSGQTYIYMAIRAPMMKEPEAATEVFAVDNPTADQPWFEGDFPVDMAFFKDVSSTQDIQLSSRLTQGKYLIPRRTVAEVTNALSAFDYNNGWYANSGINTSYVSWMWKRAKGFFDVVTYTGTSVAGRTVAHSLGVVPEMIWVKGRSFVSAFYIYDSSSGNNKYGQLGWDGAPQSSNRAWNNTTPTDALFSVGDFSSVNQSSETFVAYLFATLAGISKVGSYTGNGSSQTLNCGFAAGARFILIKRTDSTGDWYIWDTTRGIVAGNDPHLSPNTTAAQVTSDDSIDPDNSGFIVNQVSATNINVSSATYIFYAIA